MKNEYKMIISIFLLFSILLSFSGCGNSVDTDALTDAPSESVEAPTESSSMSYEEYLLASLPPERNYKDYRIEKKDGSFYLVFDDIEHYNECYRIYSELSVYLGHNVISVKSVEELESKFLTNGFTRSQKAYIARMFGNRDSINMEALYKPVIPEGMIPEYQGLIGWYGDYYITEYFNGEIYGEFIYCTETYFNSIKEFYHEKSISPVTDMYTEFSTRILEKDNKTMMVDEFVTEGYGRFSSVTTIYARQGDQFFIINICICDSSVETITDEWLLSFGLEPCEVEAE